MKKFLLISLIISSFNMNAEWVFVDESEVCLVLQKEAISMFGNTIIQMILNA